MSETPFKPAQQPLPGLPHGETVASAFAKGMTDGFADGFADGLLSFTKNDIYARMLRGEASPDEVRREQQKLRRESAKLARKEAGLSKRKVELDQLVRAAERLPQETALRIGAAPLPKVAVLRRRLSAAVFLRDDGPAMPAELLRRLHRAQWFDFRAFSDASNENMEAFGRELVGDGILRLPYDECVFVMPRHTMDEGYYSEIGLLTQGDKEITCTACGVALRDGTTIMAAAKIKDKVNLADGSYYFVLAAMSSRQASVSRLSIKSDQAIPACAADDDVYREVTIRHSVGTSPFAGGGTHVSPRLHWRRGHIRHIGERTTWVRPTLVGEAGHGTVVKDYAAKGAPS